MVYALLTRIKKKYSYIYKLILKFSDNINWLLEEKRATLKILVNNLKISKHKKKQSVYKQNAKTIRGFY